MGIDRADRQPRPLDPPPALECLVHRPPGPHHPVYREQRGHVLEWHVGRDQYHPKREAPGVTGGGFRGQHHGHIHVTGEVSQPFSVTRIRKACEAERVLVGGGRNDGVDFAAESEFYRRLDGVTGNAAGPDQPVAVWIRITAAQPPRPDGDSSLSRYLRYLVFRANERDLDVERLGQRAGRDLGTDPARISQRDGEPRT